MTRTVCQSDCRHNLEIAYGIDANNGGQLIRALTQRSSHELRLLEAEAIAYLHWLAGTTEALEVETAGGPQRGGT